MNRGSFGLALVALVLAGSGLLWFSESGRPRPRTTQSSLAAAEDSAPTASAPPAARNTSSEASRATSAEPRAPTRPLATARPGSDEAALMSQLRALGETDPKRSIELAREGNERFPDSPDAAERAWRIVKSLDTLGQFHEARDEAERMVRKYPNTRFGEDVRRHELVYPLDQPSREELQAREASTKQ